MTLTLSKKEIMNEARSAMTINIGKAGVNDNVIEEIKRQLKSNPIIKLRFAKNVARNEIINLTTVTPLSISCS